MTNAALDKVKVPQKIARNNLLKILKQTILNKHVQCKLSTVCKKSFDKLDLRKLARIVERHNLTHFKMNESFILESFANFAVAFL